MIYLYESWMNGPTINSGPAHVRLQVSRLVEVAKDGVEAGTRGGAGILRILGERYGSLDAITSRRLTGKKAATIQERKKKKRIELALGLSPLIYYTTYTHSLYSH